MARDDGEDTPWTRLLLVAVAVLVVVALGIGAALSVLALGAAQVSGLHESRPAATAEASLVIPSGQPTTRVDPYPAPEGGAPPSTRATPSPKHQPPKRKRPAISLKVSPQQVSAGERISLTGVYQSGEGAVLQVQRLENREWADFPVTTRVTGGRFSTYITTSRSGDTRLRMLDPAADKASNPVRVQVG